MQRLLRSLVVFPAWLSPAFCVCLSRLTNVGPWRPFRGVGLWHSRAGSTKVLSVMVTPKHQVVQECGGSRKPCAASRFFLPECKWEKPSKVLVCVWLFFFSRKKKRCRPRILKGLCIYWGLHRNGASEGRIKWEVTWRIKDLLVSSGEFVSQYFSCVRWWYFIEACSICL